MIYKLTTWEKWDKAIKSGEERLNNANIGDYSADSDARFDCKVKDKFWVGYKRHVAVTTENMTDDKGLELVCSDGGMVVADKSYCVKEAQEVMRKHGCHSVAILKNNMKGKNREKDRFLAGLRAPYENVFSKKQKRCRYRGIEKPVPMVDKGSCV